MTPEEAIYVIKEYKPILGFEKYREALNMAIETLKEIQQYREIGTVEECREARGKQKPKKILPLTYGLLLEDGWRHKCPNCGCAVGENIYHPDVTKDYEFCSMCGQAIYE